MGENIYYCACLRILFAVPLYLSKSILSAFSLAGDEMVIKPFKSSDVKIEQVERGSRKR